MSKKKKGVQADGTETLKSHQRVTIKSDEDREYRDRQQRYRETRKGKETRKSHQRVETESTGQTTMP